MAGEYRPEPPPVVGENPLLLSGLALAGANRRASAGPEEDDGILTAEEVAGMDLSGVDWVVLSACDTGVGEFIAGEGMFGLQRAFQVAGARTVVTSLWPVEDEATRAWMRILYQERLKGASSAEAVRNANLKMIERLRRTGLPPHPYFWGAFVAVGE
jgi:CHAT domain-containing protein